MNRQLVGRARARFAPETAANNQGQPPELSASAAIVPLKPL